MRRREFTVVLLSASLLPLTGEAQSKIYRIGVLETQPVTLNAANLDAFREGLREAGYVEGKNFVIEYRSADGHADRFPKLVAELLDVHCDVIVTRGTPAVLAAKRATSTTPIVMAALGDPLMVVASLARPGGNITGMSGYNTKMEEKRVEIMSELVPGITKIAGLYNMSNPVASPQWEALENASKILHLQARLLDVRNSEGIPSAFDAATKDGVAAIAVGVDALTQQNRDMIADLALRHRIPTIYGSREYVDAGGLIAYGPNYPSLYRQAATYVDKILKGASPAELPIQQPTTFELVINLKIAKALGLTVPQLLAAQADEVNE
jgi:putative ABC transport system substrate-binding protein